MASRAFQPKPRLLTALDIVSVVLMLAASWMVFFYAPSAHLEPASDHSYGHGAHLPGLFTTSPEHRGPAAPRPFRRNLRHPGFADCAAHLSIHPHLANHPPSGDR